MTVMIGTDVSRYQGTIHWPQVAVTPFADVAVCRMSIGRSTP